MAIYMKYGAIKGSVTTDGFKDWIESPRSKAERDVQSAPLHAVRPHASFRVKYLDLRKLRDLRLQHIPDLPLKGMQNLDLIWAQNSLRLDRMKFLDGLRALRPFHVANATTP